MKRYLLLFFLLAGGAHAGYAQSTISNRALDEFYDRFNTYQTRKYRPERGYQMVVLRSSFSTEELAALRLGERQLVRVDLVYTGFRLSSTFSQRELNIGRIRNLLAQMPGLQHNRAITWNLVEQLGCTSPAECEDYLHGFVLYLEKRYTAADSRREADSLFAKLSARISRFDRARAARKGYGKPITCAYPASRYTIKQLNRRLKQAYHDPQHRHASLTFRADVDQTGSVQQVVVEPEAGAPGWEDLAQQLKQTFAFANGFRVGGQQFPFSVRGQVQLPLRRRSLRLTGYYLADSVARKYRISLRPGDCTARQYRPDEPYDTDELPNPDADVVSKVMRRHPDWNKRVVVADVTGSMYPYTLDLLTWLQLSALQEEKTFVFFNDGNDAPDRAKPIGSTGGLYDVQTKSVDRIKEKVMEAMLAGGGGDPPENDGEALARALQLVPDATEIIMLADNHTFPRDVSLFKTGKAHVRIILCGATSYINPEYLALARRHGYSLHTLETDITDLSSVLAGQTITIQGARYLVTKDGFRLVKTL